MGENRLMQDLYEENQKLKARVAELEDKHWNECTIISQYEAENRLLKEQICEEG